MNKALNEAWDKDIKGYRSMNLSRTRSTTEKGNWGGEGGENYEQVKIGGYAGLDEGGRQQFATAMTHRAKEMHTEHIRGEESAKRMAGKKARGGMGARGSTIMTGGHKGVLEEAKTKKKTLIGA